MIPPRASPIPMGLTSGFLLRAIRRQLSESKKNKFSVAMRITNLDSGLQRSSLFYAHIYEVEGKSSTEREHSIPDVCHMLMSGVGTLSEHEKDSSANKSKFAAECD